MHHWTCEWESCEKPAAQRTGDCLLCDKHLCRTHRQEQWHKCPKPEEDWESYSAQYATTEARHIDELRRRIDSSELCARASMLRNGIPCTVDLSQKGLSTMMGNQNCHAELVFEMDFIAAPGVRDWILRSEAAAMTYLQRYTRIPSPKIYDWACESDPENPLGVGYILMEKLDGKSIDWQAATLQQKDKVMQQLVDIFLEIERHPFKAIGSPILVGDTIDIQGLTYQSTFRAGKGRLGPFSSVLEWLQDILEAYLAMIASGEIDPCYPVETYLVHRFRQDIIGSLLADVSPGDQFFLKHPDDKGDHILVDDSFNVVGIIDWEWTQTVSKAEAAIFRERGRDDLADYVVKGRKIQRFFFALGVESSFLDMETLLPLFARL
ncbi:hypothetical protein PENARI_c004G02648 [Penicillium arizonense]|uniref:Aminoglycoside phosphotransferase domain-containing protein n=1 Tax=Penicillium arizonense TaxID=1835702 RepID=A0A1F5LQA4_PENAI|nr:hypothetical protein PENARI_c004G02648 [Penicillium arizonense]OGE55402.1 hypothetical protein PENARI_c004G02648 [Penicillium arizonense]